ncbi:hypothetical protein NC653_031917 [Populus alba x Populus x berolinensis]|uniref:Secreted protein n=1 Tax=Populus alba x Populus x berolinensis TaxID=444605 RepID=A0AAD6M0P1_9ROSI|nr:hypothetical protein NC653_031917 [Populus alba x Populus x berolinensis]
MAGSVASLFLLHFYTGGVVHRCHGWEIGGWEIGTRLKSRLSAPLPFGLPPHSLIVSGNETLEKGCCCYVRYSREEEDRRLVSGEEKSPKMGAAGLCFLEGGEVSSRGGQIENQKWRGAGLFYAEGKWGRNSDGWFGRVWGSCSRGE